MINALLASMRAGGPDLRARLQAVLMVAAGTQLQKLLQVGRPKGGLSRLAAFPHADSSSCSIVRGKLRHCLGDSYCCGPLLLLAQQSLNSLQLVKAWVKDRAAMGSLPVMV